MTRSCSLRWGWVSSGSLIPYVHIGRRQDVTHEVL